MQRELKRPSRCARHIMWLVKYAAARNVCYMQCHVLYDSFLPFSDVILPCWAQNGLHLHTRPLEAHVCPILIL
jgi:hypothetical protein